MAYGHGSDTGWIITSELTQLSRDDARVVRTRAALREALTALAGEQSFESMTVRAIAARAGVGYATFFRHYRDKEELLSDLADQEITDLLAILTPLLGRQQTLETARALCAFVEERLAPNRALLAGGAGQVVREALLQQSLRRVAALSTDSAPELTSEAV